MSFNKIFSQKITIFDEYQDNLNMAVLNNVFTII